MRAFIFPGQGSQSVGMGAALADASRTARDVFEEVDEALGQKLSRLMRDGAVRKKLRETDSEDALYALVTDLSASRAA